MDDVITKENIYRGKILEGARRGEGQSRRAGRGGEDSGRAGGGQAGDWGGCRRSAAEGAEDVRGTAQVGVGAEIARNNGVGRGGQRDSAGCWCHSGWRGLRPGDWLLKGWRFCSRKEREFGSNKHEDISTTSRPEVHGVCETKGFERSLGGSVFREEPHVSQSGKVGGVLRGHC